MENRPTDERGDIYRDLHSGQLEAEESQNRHSARIILGILFEEFMPASVLDVGCGLGTWLSVAQELGVKDIQGVDGAWLDKTRLRIPERLVQVLDLEKPFDLGRRFDLAICLEVAEHLDGASARGFVSSLVSHSEVLLFSAAIPLQGGHHHVNEQWPDYWRTLFEDCGFEMLDSIRGRIWADNSVHLWLRQNVFLVVKKTPAGHDSIAARFTRLAPPLSVVHPELYLLKLQHALSTLEEYGKVQALLAGGGNFNVRREPDGRITITRI